MRKTAYVIATTCVAFILLGTVLRFMRVPGAGLLTLLSAGLFAGIALPLNLFGSLRDKKTGRRRTIEIVGTLFAMHVVVYLLFRVQNWPGSDMFLLQGGVLGIVFAILLAIALKNNEEPLKPFVKFNTATLIFCGVMMLSLLATSNKNEERDRLVHLNAIETAKCDSLRKVVQVIYFDLQNSDESDSLKARALTFQVKADELIAYINRIQAEVASENSYGVASVPESDTFRTLLDPMNIDIPTYYFIGPDVQNITGKGPELYQKLANYRDEVLHPDVPFFVRMNSTFEENTQWVKDNFYHATSIEAMTRLTLLKENIYQSMQYSIDNSLFR